MKADFIENCLRLSLSILASQLHTEELHLIDQILTQKLKVYTQKL